MARKVEDWPKIEFRGITYVLENWFAKYFKRIFNLGSLTGLTEVQYRGLQGVIPL